MTFTPDLPPAASPRRRSLGLRFAIAFLLGVVLVIGVGGGALYAYGQQYTGKVLPGVRVGDVDLSGLDPATARQTLEAAFAPLGAGRVAISGPDGELTIGYAEIGRRADVEAMLSAALTAGRRGEPVADLLGVPQVALRGVLLSPRVVYDEAKLVAAVAAVAATVNEDPVDATLARADDGSYAVTRSKDGRVVDEAALLSAIGARIGDLDAPAELRVDLPFTTLSPPIDTADAEAALAAGERMSADLVLTRGKQSWKIGGARLRSLITYSPTIDGSIVPIVDVAGLDPLIEKIAKDVNTKPLNAAFKLGSSGRITGVKPGHDGLALDVEATRAEVLDALMARQAGEAEAPLEPVVGVTPPALSTKDAERWAPRMKPLAKGRWTTWFPIYENNGFGANIWIPAKLINGYVVAPGETFDFWKAVGTVTRDKGFRQGGAIINGRTEPQGALAGGICSCSTTLFNAALRAGYKMGARRNHYYYIDRYPLGLDATVFISGSGSKQTMSFTNDTEYPVLIRGINTRKGGTGYVTFQMYSVPINRRVVIGPATVKNVRPAGDSVQYTSSMRKGTSKRIEYPVDGKDVWRTVTVYENGKVLRSTTYYSHYARITGVVLVGTGGAPRSDPSPTP